jgi:2,4-dienoyl-CoA reductase-like NADH-dependent reductase (Old Yellow Enzyme family)
VLTDKHGNMRENEQIAWDDKSPVPHELTKDEIQAIVQAFADAAVRADKAGFDVVEIHGAHGYLISSFNSPLANHRTDEYGGSFEVLTRPQCSVCGAACAVCAMTLKNECVSVCACCDVLRRTEPGSCWKW